MSFLKLLYSFLDVLVLPLFWLPPGVSLTAASLLVGLLLMGVYAKTSDQWALAHHKQRLKRLQFRLLSGDFSVPVLKGLARHNLRMAGLGLVPAVVCVVVLVALIPWVGTRFGFHLVAPMQPVSVTVEAEAPWTLETDRGLRVTPRREPYDKGTTRLRMLSETRTPRDLVLTGEDGEVARIPLRTGSRRSPLWPVHVRSGWILTNIQSIPPNLANPVLNADGPVDRVAVDYPMAFGALTFTIPPFLGMPAWGLSGWLSWLFIAATISGLWAKSQWEIE